MTKNKKILTIAIAGLSVGIVTTAIATGSGTAVSKLPSRKAQAHIAAVAAQTALPGVSVTLTSPSGENGSILTLKIPQSDLDAPAASMTGFDVPSTSRIGSFEAGEAGWRAGMIGAYDASKNPSIVGWELEPTEGPATPEADNYLHARLREGVEDSIGWPTASFIGQTTQTQAVRQLQSNLSVLKSVVGPAITDTAVQVIPIGTQPETFGLEADVRVNVLSELAPHIGDVFLGLSTGLVGAPNATIEGLAINVVDSAGERASAWMNGRDGDAAAEATGETLNPTNAHTADVSFPVQTSGPATLTSSTGTGPETRSGTLRTPSNKASTP